MDRASIQAYAARQRERYQGAGRETKSQILDEVVAVTGYHRKAAIRLLAGRKPPTGGQRRPGRPTVYGPEVRLAVRRLYEAAGGIGVKRLHPFIPELAARLQAHGAFFPRSGTLDLLRQVSPATLERLLAPDPQPYQAGDLASAADPGAAWRHKNGLPEGRRGSGDAISTRGERRRPASSSSRPSTEMPASDLTVLYLSSRQPI